MSTGGAVAAQTEYGLHDVSVRHDGDMALIDIDLPIAAGQVTAVVGGDGAGKTTALQTLVGLLQPVAGTVVAPDKQHLGYLPSAAGSWPQLSVQENMEFAGQAFGLTGEALADRITDLLGSAGLDRVRQRLSSQLSGGMRKKLGFSMALLAAPDLLVLDEPSTGVDPVSRVELWALMSSAAAAGTAVVMSTTYMEEAERCSHVLALENGYALLAGPPDVVTALMPGDVVTADAPSEPRLAWRKGASFRQWWPKGAPDGIRSAPTRLEDAVIVASLDRRLKQAAGHG